MFSKVGLAAASLAIASLMVVSVAEAQSRTGNGKRAKNATTGQQVKRTANRSNRNIGRTAKRTVSRNAGKAVTASQSSAKTPSQIQIARRIARNIWRSNWRDRRIGARYPYARPHGCVAVARTRGGFGRPIGIRGQARGFRACQKARRQCNRQLANRQARGRNPFARCIVMARR